MSLHPSTVSLGRAVLATILVGVTTTAGLNLLSRAQQAAPGEPAQGRALPHADPPFQGDANRTLAGSKPDFPHQVAPPKGAPNVLLVLIDDASFGNPSTGGRAAWASTTSTASWAARRASTILS